MRVASLFTLSAFVTALALATIPVTIACSDGVSPPDSSNHQIQLDNTYWTELGLDGHWLSAISETPWGLFAGTLGGGVFRLEPSDGKWVPLGLDHAQIGAIAFVPGSPDRLLVSVKPYADEQTDAAVFASEDGGATWAPSDDGLAVRNDRRFWSYSLAVAPTEPAKVFWGGNASILRSEDGGRHWSFVYGAEDWWGPGIGAMTVAPGGNGRVWAGGMTAIFLPTVIRMDAWGDTVQQLFISPNNENSVYSLALDPRNPDRLLAGMMGGVLYSDDDAETWNLSLVVDDLHGWVWTLAVQGNSVYAATMEDFSTAGDPLTTRLGLYVTGDSGESWEAVPVPEGVAGAQSLLVHSDGRLLIGTAGSGLWSVEIR